MKCARILQGRKTAATIADLLVSIAALPGNIGYFHPAGDRGAPSPDTTDLTDRH
jgi:hypothetical protein